MTVPPLSAIAPHRTGIEERVLLPAGPIDMRGGISSDDDMLNVKPSGKTWQLANINPLPTQLKIFWDSPEKRQTTRNVIASDRQPFLSRWAFSQPSISASGRSQASPTPNTLDIRLSEHAVQTVFCWQSRQAIASLICAS
jgi:hypothetical protein